MKKDNLIIILTAFFYKILLDLSYFFIISKKYDYVGFNLNFDSLKFIESYMLLFIVFTLMPKTKKRLSHIVIWLAITFSYVPILTIFAFQGETRIYIYAITGFWLLIFCLLKTPLIFKKPLKQVQTKIIIYSFFSLFFLVVFFIIYNYFNITLNFNLKNVYDIRKSYTKLNIPFSGYLFIWMAHIINPTFLVLFLKKKKWIRVIAILILQILLFSVTGLKSFIFVIPLVLFLVWTMGRKNSFKWILLGLCFILLFGLISFLLTENILISNFFTRRALFVPANLSFNYYNFFSNNPHTFLSQHHLFRNFIKYPYELPPGALIAKEFFNKSEGNACNGIYADGYMNFGFIGFIMWAIILTIILKLMDSFSKNKNITLIIATVSSFATINIINNALLTTLVTHGLPIALLLLYLLPKEKIKEKNE